MSELEPSPGSFTAGPRESEALTVAREVSHETALSFKEAKAQLVERFEREYLLRLLRRCDGNLSRAARESGMHRKSIERLVSRYQLDPRKMKRSAR
jgi:ActR/RegA family two-component response regulator